MSTLTSHAVHSERPERSRNAKAQARHRAKRKAYIEQLEQTVTKLQTALGLTPDQVAVLPSPLAKIRDLEQENARLQKENEDLRRMVAEASGSRGIHLDATRRNPLVPFQDPRMYDRDYKRRKMSGHIDGVYLVSHSNGDTAHDIRPPPLTIPQVPSHYNSVPSSGNGTPNSAMFNMHPHAFQVPNTPSGSSSTSSPPFSPPQMHAPQNPINPRPSVANHHVMSTYSHNQYSSVKVEDDHYSSSNHNYSLPPYNVVASENGIDSWHGYSSERDQLQR